MKVRKEELEGFKPFELVITVDSIMESEAWYAVLNYTPISDFLREYRIDPERIRSLLGGNDKLWSELESEG